MLQGATPVQRTVLIVDDGLAELDTAAGRATESLAKALEGRSVTIIRAFSLDDGLATVISEAALGAVMLNWNLGGDSESSHAQATALLHRLRERQEKVPVYLLADREGAKRSITVEVAEMVEEFVWLLEGGGHFRG